VSAGTRSASYTGSRPDVIGLIPYAPKRVLDIGCSDGSLAVALHDAGAETWGIEPDPEFALRASERLDHVLQGDALARATELADNDEQFDLVVCADVLEHLVDPWAVLRIVRQLVVDDGALIVSLPNVQFYTTLVWLIFKRRWRYLDRGVHDRTHLRWFTDLDARDMFLDAGFRVETMTSHYRLFDRPGAKAHRFARFLAVGWLKPFLAYQYLYRLRPVVIQ
jgi:2-polyprenyl-3-methyl-5-hydroxy-6-metoxy-1,4-benzoquinol methylase